MRSDPRLSSISEPYHDSNRAQQLLSVFGCLNTYVCTSSLHSGTVFLEALHNV